MQEIITYTTRGSGIWHIYHERNSYPPRPKADGDMRPRGIWVSLMVYTVSGIQNGCHIPLPVNPNTFWFAENVGHGINIYSSTYLVLRRADLQQLAQREFVWSCTTIRNQITSGRLDLHPGLTPLWTMSWNRLLWLTCRSQCYNHRDWCCILYWMPIYYFLSRSDGNNEMATMSSADEITSAFQISQPAIDWMEWICESVNATMLVYIKCR